ncbi:MAG TPA: ATP-binding protein [Candidatus Obscuribacterales bacterium]
MRFEPKIYIKGLILVAVPLVLEVVFGIALWNLQSVYRQALDKEAHAKEIIYHANEMWLWCTDAVTSKFEVHVVPEATKSYGHELSALNYEYGVLSELVKDDPEQFKRLTKIKRQVDSLLAVADEFEKAGGDLGRSRIAVLVGKVSAFRQLQVGFHLLRTNIMDFREPLLQQTRQLTERARDLQDTIKSVITAGIVGSILLAAGLYFYFMRGINSGIQVLLNNTRRLARSQTLLPMLATTDEIGDLDRSFHQMAETLHERTAELQRVNEELARSNSELQQFAYVASHDLQEPLRAVSGYLDILTRRHGNSLDKDAQSLVQKAQDGAKRMQMLISDLLAYARVDSRGREFTRVDLNDVVEEARSNLKVAIEENSAVVSHGRLPTVLADRSQLVQLFQNLVGNAIKFRKDDPPKVSISAELIEDKWKVCVRDNGIGIDMAQADRIFTIFKRLHTRKGYPGTGIGLAICKKIVEQHGGTIWVESQPGAGSTFLFTLAPAPDEPEPVTASHTSKAPA